MPRPYSILPSMRTGNKGAAADKMAPTAARPDTGIRLERDVRCNHRMCTQSNTSSDKYNLQRKHQCIQNTHAPAKHSQVQVCLALVRPFSEWGSQAAQAFVVRSGR